MSTTRVPPAARALVEHVGAGHPLPPELRDLEGWLAASSRLRAFVDANRDKIRKKVRVATTRDQRLDVRAELRVAALLLADRRFELGFEAYGSGSPGPDFTATFRAGRPFNVEVTRRQSSGVPGLERTILGKLRQLPPSRANLLILTLPEDVGEPLDLGALMQALRSRADRRDDRWFAARGIADAASFHQGVLRLSAVVTWCERPPDASQAAMWLNPAARIGLDAAAARGLGAALGAADGTSAGP